MRAVRGLVTTLALLGALAVVPGPAAAAVRPLGTLTVLGDGDASCPEGHTCTKFSVACPGLSVDREGYLAVSPSPSGPPRGVVMFFSGGSGTFYWAPYSEAEGGVAERLVTDHDLLVVQVRWESNWQASAEGELAGTAAVACRPATVVKHVHDTVFAPMGLPSTPGICGFCVAGGSGGSAAAAYGASHYGLESILDGLFPFSGPTHAAIAPGCRRDRREQDIYWYTDGQNIDTSYGYGLSGGPCYFHDASWAARWEQDSVDGSTADLSYPATRVHVIVGEADTPSRTRAEGYVQALLDAGSPYVALEVIPAMTHGLNGDGIVALLAALTWTPEHPLSGCANGIDDDSDGFADWPNDPGCAAADDASERAADAVCDDGLDQDADGRRDTPRDAGCAGPADLAETSAARCDNGKDDDGDGAADFPGDIGCESITDRTGAGSAEDASAYPCDNGLDDDGDGETDYRTDDAGDAQCASNLDPSETNSGSGGNLPTLTIGTRDVFEGPEGSTTACRITVNLVPASTKQVTVNYATSNGKARAGTDYVAASGTAKIKAGTTRRVITVVVNGDGMVEPAEPFYVNLSSPTNAQLGNTRGTCTIGNDD